MRADEVPPMRSPLDPSDALDDFESDTDSWALGEDITGEITNEQETEVTAELPASNPLPPPPPVPQPLRRPKEPSGPRTVAQIRRPSDPEPDPFNPAEPQQHREAHATLRNIRAARDDDSEDAYMPDAEWSHSKRKRNVTVLAALAGMSLIFTSAAGIYWGIGSLFPLMTWTVKQRPGRPQINILQPTHQHANRFDDLLRTKLNQQKTHEQSPSPPLPSRTRARLRPHLLPLRR